MKKIFSFLFVLTFIIAATSLMSAATIYSIGSIPGSVSSAGVATGGGLWSATTTWAGGVVPTAADSIVIVSGDLVIGGGNASSLTVKSGAAISQTASVTCTTGGTFTLESGSWWYASYSSATKMPQGFGTYNIDPASNWVFTTLASSSLINALPSAGPVIYGNVIVYKTGAVLAAATTITDINIQGNLTVNDSGSTLKSSNNKSSALTTIHVGGNVLIIAGGLSCVDAVTQATTCIYNIDGNVTVGVASTTSGIASLASVSGADAGYLRTGTFNIKGNLSYINGAKFEAGTSTASTNTSEASVINLKGNLSTDATVGTKSNTLGTFKINFVGTTAQTISLGAPLVFSSPTTLTINNAAGVTLTSPADLDSSTILSLVAGKLNTSSTNLLTISGTGSISGGSSSSFVAGPLAYNNVVTSSKSFVYPIGKDTVYRPVTLSLTQTAITASTYSVELFNAVPPANTFPGTLNKVSTAGYYKISEGSGGSAFTAGSVLLNYGVSDGVSDVANLRIAQGPATGTWNDLGGTGIGSPIGTITSTNSFTDLTTNTIFTLANHTGGSNILPVELSSFMASNNGRNIQLNWVTQTEKNSSAFEINRALVNPKDASVTWESVGTVQASGTSTNAQKYSFTEKNLQAGKYQYRLKMIDFDGSYQYSNVVEAQITLPKNFDLSQNYPNPFNPSTKINYNLPFDSKVTLEVYNIAGERIGQLVNEEKSAGYYTVDFNSSSLNKNISSGVYLYRITAVDKATGNNFSSIKKMILLK
jgi:hypothetical protein